MDQLTRTLDYLHHEVRLPQLCGPRHPEHLHRCLQQPREAALLRVGGVQVSFKWPTLGGETDSQEEVLDPREREGIGGARLLALLMKNGSDIELFTLAKDIPEGPLKSMKDIGQLSPGFLVTCYFLRTGSDCVWGDDGLEGP